MRSLINLVRNTFINKMVALVGFLCVFSFFIICQTMKVIPERVTIHYYNQLYVEHFNTNVRRYNRKGGYYLNVEGEIKQPWGNNVSLDIVLFEYLHNEYKRTFVEFHFDKGCDFVNNDPYIGSVLHSELLKIGVTSCPVPAKFYRFSNLSLAVDQFPYVWPFEKALALGIVSCNKKQTLIANVSLYMRFEQKPNKGRNIMRQ